MKYISTRGKAKKLNFEEVLLAGLASDGGLYVPENIPEFTPQQIASWSDLSYPELAKVIMMPFVEDSISANEFKKIIDKSYKNFRHSAVAPLKQIGSGEWVLELFHGPTLAFKDFALQLLGNLLDYVLEKHNQKVVILGATSGDTGSAAIEGCKDCNNVDIFILHPQGRTSDIQRKQMTTVLSENVHNVAIKGTFDDCQDIVKSIFMDKKFLGNKSLVAVNSINWARIMAQIVYYFYAAISLGAPARKVSFSVPTGNFGDIFAGYMAYQMGLPIDQLVIATNKNDILHRFISDNDYSKKGVTQTLSPSMDIQVSSNFERLLFYVHDEDSGRIARLMEGFKKTGKLSVNEQVLGKIRKLFTSYSVTDDVICKVMREIYVTTGESVDPHTATGIKAARATRKDDDVPMIILATAHPAKFPEASNKAKLPDAQLPTYMQDIFSRKERFDVLKNDIEEVKKYIKKNV